MSGDIEWEIRRSLHRASQLPQSLRWYRVGIWQNLHRALAAPAEPPVVSSRKLPKFTPGPSTTALTETRAEMPEEPESTTEVVDAILFAVDEQKPRMIKVQVDTMPGDEYDRPWKKLRAEPWFSDTPLAADTSGIGSSVRSLLVGRQWSNGPPLEHGLSLCIRYDENFLINKSKKNRCIQRLTNGKALHPWAGNFYVVRTDGFQEHNYFSANMAEDLPALKNYFETYGR